MRIFLYNFEKNRAIYVNEMNSLSVSSLSCDHTVMSPFSGPQALNF